MGFKQWVSGYRSWVMGLLNEATTFRFNPVFVEPLG